MKGCHTKADGLESGNAITVNSPLISIKHFFCHCAMCGSGFDDYSQLSLHEGEKHNYRCDNCDEGFLIEADLASHKTTHEVDMDVENSSKDKEASQCNECGMIFENTTDLNDHQASEHVSETIANEADSNGQEKADNVHEKQLENNALKEMIHVWHTWGCN